MEVKLRKLSLMDLFGLIRALSDEEVSKRLSYKEKSTFFKALNEILRRKDNFKFSIIVNEKFAGGIMLENFDNKDNSCNVGYFVAKEYWGKGIATLAVKKILKFAFNKLKVKKVKADNDLDNPASGKVLKKAGFKLVKVIKGKNLAFWEKKDGK
jgi:ribosomal-protein-alanine N-acetyltransferase